MEQRVQDEVDKEEDELLDRELTQKEANDYIAGGGLRCPYCNSDRLETMNHEYYESWIEVDITCGLCGKTWIEQYQMVGLRFDDPEQSFSYEEEIIPYAQDTDN